MRCGVWRAATDALGILTRSLVITGMMATGTISAGPALTAAATMAAALVRAGRGHLSDRSGIAADQPIAQGPLDRSDGLRPHFSDFRCVPSIDAVRLWQIVLQKSKIERLRKFREDRFLDVSTGAKVCRADTKALPISRSTDPANPLASRRPASSPGSSGCPD
jgi:hypothetical protein